MFLFMTHKQKKGSDLEIEHVRLPAGVVAKGSSLLRALVDLVTKEEEGAKPVAKR